MKRKLDLIEKAYEYVMRSNILKESSKEKTILEMTVKGSSLKEIQKATNYSLRTINYRKKEIYNKIKCLIDYTEKDGDIEEYYTKQNQEKHKINGEEKFILTKENTGLFKVYLLTFPNEKVYVGITSQDESKRWNNGQGYIKNEVMYNDILKYGWINIKKNILYKDLFWEEALEKEKELIINYKSHLKRYGYNRDF